MAVPVQIVIDCADPDGLSRFWAEALGYIVQPPPDGFDSWESALATWGVPESEWNSASAVVDPAGAGPRIYFQRVPERKQVKNRVHLDLNVGVGSDLAADQRRQRIDEVAERLMSIGASRVEWRERHGEGWLVMTDPEGNEFCLQ